MTTATDTTWELEYKLHEPFGRGHWVLCKTKNEAMFHLRNLANNLPKHYVYVTVFEDGKETSYKGSGRDMHHRIFPDDK